MLLDDGRCAKMLAVVKSSKNRGEFSTLLEASGTKVCTKQTFVPEQFCAIIRTRKNRESIENIGFFIGAVAKW